MSGPTVLFDRADDLSVEVVPAEGLAWVAFDRVAPTLVDAVVSGVRDLDAAGVGIDRAVDDDPLRHSRGDRGADRAAGRGGARLGRVSRAGQGTSTAAGRTSGAGRARPGSTGTGRWRRRVRRAGAAAEAGGGHASRCGCAPWSPRLERMPPIRSLLYP